MPQGLLKFGYYARRGGPFSTGGVRMDGPTYDWEAHRALARVPGARAQTPLVRHPGDGLLPGLLHGLHPARGVRAGLHGRSVYEGLTVGYCLALTQFVMVFALGIMYLRRADREYDPLAEQVVELADVGGRSSGRRGSSATDAAATQRRCRDDRPRRRRQRRGGRHLRDRPLHHARHHLLGVQARDRAPSASTPPAARSRACRTASRSPATTCRPRRSSASPA